MDLGITGRRAVVAAASSGLGLASARALRAEGVEVAICGRNQARIEAAAREIGAVPFVADVSRPEEAAGFIASAVDALGGLDILVANAGGPPTGTFSSTSFEEYPKALELNLLSTVALCQAIVPDLVTQGWGRVVAITSVSVRQPIDQLILSNTARAGATGFLKTLAREVAGTGVTVNSVQPGLHLTDRLRNVYGDALEGRQIGDPDDFGQIVAFVCSEQASYLTGAAINIDGGDYAGLQ